MSPPRYQDVNKDHPTHPTWSDMSKDHSGLHLWCMWKSKNTVGEMQNIALAIWCDGGSDQTYTSSNLNYVNRVFLVTFDPTLKEYYVTADNCWRGCRSLWGDAWQVAPSPPLLWKMPPGSGSQGPQAFRYHIFHNLYLSLMRIPHCGIMD